jgi:transcriptional regulator with XRE-family HTH domain
MAIARPTVDQLIGMRIRERRAVRGLTRRELGGLVGITSTSKYEQGIISISFSLLYEIARALGTPLEYFFEGLEQDESQSHPRSQRLLYEVMRDVGDIRDERCLEGITLLTRALAGRTRPRAQGARPRRTAVPRVR